MHLERFNRRTLVTEASDEEIAWLDDYLSFADKAAYFREKVATGDGLIHLFTHEPGASASFPAGWTPLVRLSAREKGFTSKLVDARIAPCSLDTAVDVSWLRPYQKEAFDAVVRNRVGLVWHPTASGKGELIVALVSALPCRWAFVVHRTHLVHDVASRYAKRTGEPVGVIADGKIDVPAGCRLICATFQALERLSPALKQQFLLGVEGVAVDEAHTVGAATFRAVLRSMPNAFWRVGFSGTPLDRSDARSFFVIAELGPVVHHVKISELVEQKYIAKSSVFMLRHTEHVEATAGSTWQGISTRGITLSTKRNKLLARAAVLLPKPAMLFVSKIAHGKAMEKLILKSGVQARFVWGAAPTEVRERAVRDLEAGRIDVLVSSAVLIEGTNVPTLRSVLFGLGGKSAIQVHQSIGRAMRIAKDKTSFIAVDVLDVGCDCRAVEDPGTPVDAIPTTDTLGDANAHDRAMAWEAYEHGRAAYDAERGCRMLWAHAQERLKFLRDEHDVIVLDDVEQLGAHATVDALAASNALAETQRALADDVLNGDGEDPEMADPMGPY